MLSGVRVYGCAVRRWELPVGSRASLPALVRGPLEFGSRVVGYTGLGIERVLRDRAPYKCIDWRAALRDLEINLGPVTNIQAEPALNEIEQHTRRILAEIRGEDPFKPRWAVDSLLAGCCYLICRLIEPDVVVETGVAYGVSSAFILKALEENGHGTLYSIDLPPLRRNYEKFWGVAVPEALKGRWELHRGPSRRVLPDLLEKLGALDMFIHDSLHTRRNMRAEFDLAWPRMRRGGVALADDVERNRAFGELYRKAPVFWRVVRDLEKRSLYGRAEATTFGITIK